jgi:predicted metalloprotease
MAVFSANIGNATLEGGKRQVDIGGRRRSSNFEDRGRGGGASGGGVPLRILSTIAQKLGLKGTLVVGAVLAVGYFVAPKSLTQAVLRALSGNPEGTGQSASGAGSVCESSPANGKACDFSRVVLASTEDVWAAQFQGGALPRYEAQPGAYRNPTLVVFSGSVATAGCGNASSDVGPFYCSADSKLYIDPDFYGVMEQRLKAPGDFAQAYVIAHEVGHHVQNLIGAKSARLRGESANQSSVRIELQADCLAGVWGHTARASLKISDEDLREALTAAHAIGDDTLGHSNANEFTHGTSAQRIRWFRRGFEQGDARQCDTFSVANYAAL